MPSRSKSQQRMMNAVAHNPAFAKKVGIPTSVGQDFVAADKKAGKKYAGGGILRVEEALRRSGVGDPEPAPAAPPPPKKSASGIEYDTGPRDRKQAQLDAMLAKRAAEDARERKARGYAKGGSIDGCATRGKTKVRYV